MRALFLSPNVPFPPLNGGHHRNLGLIRCLSHVATVHVCAIGDPRDERTTQARRALSDWNVTIEVHQPTGPGPEDADRENTQRVPDAFSHYRSPGLKAALARLSGSTRFDLVHVEEVVMAQYLDLLPWPRVIDRQKLDWAYHEAMAGVAPGDAARHLREAVRFRRFERRLIGEFARMLVPGRGDLLMIEPLHGTETPRVVPIAIPDDLRSPEQRARGVEFVLLYGALDYPPNVAGQEWFFRNVWPELRQRAPELRVVIVGSGRPPIDAQPPPLDARVERRGFVPDIRSVLGGPGVLIVPVRIGGGARTKILEAMACGMPVVSTSAGAENIDLVPGRDFLQADTAEQVIDAITRLTRDADLVETLRGQAELRVEPHRFSRIDALLQSIYRDVAMMCSVAKKKRQVTEDNPLFDVETRRLEERIEELRRVGGASHADMRYRAIDRFRDAVLRGRLGPPIKRLLDRVLTQQQTSERTEIFRRIVARLLSRLVRH